MDAEHIHDLCKLQVLLDQLAIHHSPLLFISLWSSITSSRFAINLNCGCRFYRTTTVPFPRLIHPELLSSGSYAITYWWYTSSWIEPTFHKREIPTNIEEIWESFLPVGQLFTRYCNCNKSTNYKHQQNLCHCRCVQNVVSHLCSTLRSAEIRLSG